MCLRWNCLFASINPYMADALTNVGMINQKEYIEKKESGILISTDEEPTTDMSGNLEASVRPSSSEETPRA